MTRARISVLSYNGERFLADALDSALAQTYPDVEVVVVDDGSTDDSRQVVERYRGRGVRWEQNPANLGLSRNWTHAARDVDADYVAVLHQDDRLRPEFMATLVADLEAAPDALAAICNVQVVDAGLSPLSVPRFERRRRRAGGRFDEDDYRLLLLGNYVYGCGWLARPALFDDREFAPDLGWVPDWDLWLDVLADPSRVVRQTALLAEYRLHDQSLSYDEQTLLRRLREEQQVVERALSRRPVAPSVARRARAMVDVRAVAYAGQVLAAGRPRVAAAMLGQLAAERGAGAVLRGAAGLAVLPDVWATVGARAQRLLNPR